MVLIVLVVALLLTAVLPAVAQDDFVFGMVLVGPKDDRGWSQAHYEGAVYLEENLPGARMLLFESLNAVDSPDVTLAEVVALFVEEGAQIIFTTSDAFEEDTAAVAPLYPDVVFINVSGDDVLIGDAPANLGNVMAMSEWARVISGCAAALSSETGKIGYLGPLINAETRRVAASAYLGANYCWDKYSDSDEALVFDVIWIGFWFPIPGVTLDATEESNRFFDQGYDIVLSGIDTAEMVTAAARRQEDGMQVYAIPYNNPAGCEQGPAACLGVVYYNWGPQYAELSQAVIDGTWEPAWDWVTPNFEALDDPASNITGFQSGEGLGEDAAATLAEFVAEVTAYALDPMHADSIYLWEGPLNLQDGTELAADGVSVNLLDIWYLSQLLEGMGGASVSE
jgi:simple sugar transport system substrate-binding protein